MTGIPDLLDLDEVASKLRMKRDTLRHLRRERGWPCVRAGTGSTARILFTPEQVQHIIDDLTENQKRTA